MIEIGILLFHAFFDFTGTASLRSANETLKIATPSPRFESSAAIYRFWHFLFLKYNNYTF